MNYSKAIEIYCEKSIDFKSDVILQDDGDGVYIKEWNVAGKTEPTIAELETIWNDNALDYAKAEKNEEIDARTRQLIGKGYNYNGTLLSLSDQAQANMSAYYIKIITDPAPDTNLFPIGWSNMAGGEYVIEDQAAFIAIYDTGMARKKLILDQGRALRLQVLNAANQAEIDAVEDLRT